MRIIRRIVTYVVAMFIIAFFIPTDVPTLGAKPLSQWKMAVQVLAIYDIPLILIVIDIKYFQKKRF